MPRTVIDLSHPIHDGMDAYPGLPSPAIGLHIDHEGSRAQYDEQAEFAIGRFELVGNVGTYLDSPFHRYADGPDVADLPLAGLVDLPTTVVDAREQARHGRCLDLVLADYGSLAGRAVLVRTDWDRRWGAKAYWEPGPYLGDLTIEQLLHHRPAIVGVDFWNIDDPADPVRPAHTRLLGDGIPIVEHLTGLGEIPVGARSFFVPLPIKGAPSVPIRAFALAARTLAPRGVDTSRDTRATA